MKRSTVVIVLLLRVIRVLSKIIEKRLHYDRTISAQLVVLTTFSKLHNSARSTSRGPERLFTLDTNTEWSIASAFSMLIAGELFSVRMNFVGEKVPDVGAYWPVWST